MDNLTHTMFGAALTKTTLGRYSPLATPMIVVMANLPDLDFVTSLGGNQLNYLCHHRGITHSLFGILIIAALASTLVWLAECRWWSGQSPPQPFNLKRGPLLPILIGLLSHPALDALNTYGIRPWLPFDDRWYYGDLAFIVDPWLWLLFGGTFWILGENGKKSTIFAILMAAITMVIIYTVDRTPTVVRYVWPFALLLVILLQKTRVGVTRPRTTLATSASLVTLYLAGLFFLGEAAREASRNQISPLLKSTEQLGQSTKIPRAADPFQWRIVWETSDRILSQSYDLLNRKSYQKDPLRIPHIFERNLHHPNVQIGLKKEEAQIYKSFARHLYARIQPNGDFSFHDARYQLFPGTSWCSYTPSPAGQEQP